MIVHHTRYLHCSKLLIRRGDRVRRGQVIALVGSTGASSGPHLHHDHAVEMPAFRASLARPGDLLEVGRALPGCGGGLAIPVEQVIAWVRDHAPGRWPPLLAEDADWLLPIDPARVRRQVLRVTDTWYGRRPVYTADGSHRRGRDGRELVARHQGIDLSAREGTEILASADGMVVLARTGSPSAGNWIVLEHG